MLALARTLESPGADVQLLGAEGFQRHSAAVLRVLLNASPPAQPLLARFGRLETLALFCREEEAHGAIDAAAFHQLPKLSSLTISGARRGSMAAACEPMAAACEPVLKENGGRLPRSP